MFLPSQFVSAESPWCMMNRELLGAVGLEGGMRGPTYTDTYGKPMSCHVGLLASWTDLLPFRDRHRGREDAGHAGAGRWLLSCGRPEPQVSNWPSRSRATVDRPSCGHLVAPPTSIRPLSFLSSPPHF